MTYAEIIDRASFEAHNARPEVEIDMLRVAAEAAFPSVVEELAKSVAMDLNHPWRSVLKDTTAALTNGAEIPQTSTNSKQIIGVYGAVRDGADSKFLTDVFTPSEIRKINENPGTFRKIPVYAYAIVKPRIFHTRTTVIIDVCVLDEAAVATAIAADQVPLFPDAEGAYVTALVDKLSNPNLRFGADSQRMVKAA